MDNHVFGSELQSTLLVTALLLTGEICGPGKMTFKIKEIGSLNYGTLLVISDGSFFVPQ